MKQMGYFFLDHSNSPGLPEDIARKAGYDPKLTGEGKVYEADSFTCPHCKSAVIMHLERERPRETCEKCTFSNGVKRYICDGCAWIARQPGYIHTTLEQAYEYGLDPTIIYVPRWGASKEGFK
jgi:hypothetical protein